MICLVHETSGGKIIHTPTGLRQPTIRTFLPIQSSEGPGAHDNGPTQRRSSFPMLARLLFREQTYSGPSQGVRGSRYIRTVKLLNNGRGVCPRLRTRLLEDELRFQACHGIRTRPWGNARLERYAEDGQPGQKPFSHTLHGLRKGTSEESMSRSITCTYTASQPPRVNHRTHDTSHMVHTGPLRYDSFSQRYSPTCGSA